MSRDWKNEDDIKAELRILTDELRTLRHELRNMVTPQKPKNPSRAFLHRHSWSGMPRPDATAADRTEGPPKQKQKDDERDE
jgi:hypothetical protein